MALTPTQLAMMEKLRATVRAKLSVVDDANSRFQALKDRIAARKAEALKLRPPKIGMGDLSGNITTDEMRLKVLKDDATNWATESLLVLGQHQLCTCCGHRAESTSGFFLRQRHNFWVGARRLKRVQAIVDGLPIEVVSEGVLLARCINCVANETRADDLLAATVFGEGPSITNQLSLELH